MEGHGKYVKYERSRRMISLSTKITDDSAFPFKPGDDLKIRTDPKAKLLIVEKAPKTEKGEKKGKGSRDRSRSTEKP